MLPNHRRLLQGLKDHCCSCQVPAPDTYGQTVQGCSSSASKAGWCRAAPTMYSSYSWMVGGLQLIPYDQRDRAVPDAAKTLVEVGIILVSPLSGA